ncbi:MAG TPA: signal peptidase I, partial [Candidatus Deferrimicrobiaceae bacterium]
IVVFIFPVNPEEDLIKRVIGLPGDTITIQNGVLSINGVVMNEPYISAPPAYEGNWTVSPGELFVLGDNRNDSRDSHQWGLLPIKNVIGRAAVIYWPPKEWQIIKHTQQVSIPASAQLESWSIR